MFALKYKGFIIGLLLIGGLISAYFLPDLRISYDINNFFPERDEDVEFYREFCNQFGSDETFIMIAIHENKGVLNSKCLNQVHDLTRNCQKMEHVKHAESITTLKEFVKAPVGWMSIPILHYDEPLRYSADSIKIYQNELIPGLFLSADARTACILLSAKHGLTEESRYALIDSISDKIDSYSFQEVYMVGKIVTEVRHIRRMEKERIIAVSLILIFTTIISFFIFRSWKIILLLTASIILGLIYLYGYFGIFNRSLNLLSTLFPTIILVVGMSDFIHIYSKYYDGLSMGQNKLQSMRIAIQEIGLATFLTSLTTAAGFIALTTSDILPIRQFGVNVSIGVMLTYVIVLGMLSSFVLLMDKTPLNSKGLFYRKDWHSLLASIYRTVIKNQYLISFAFVLILFISAVGISMIDTNSFLMSHVSNHSSLKNDVYFFEDHLSGIRSIELVFTSNSGEHDFHKLEKLKEIEKIHRYLKEKLNVRWSFSPVDMIKIQNKSHHGGVLSYYNLPEDQVKLDNLFESKSFRRNLFGIQCLSNDGQSARLHLKMKDIGAKKTKEFSDHVLKWAEANLNLSGIDYQITGTDILFDKSNQLLVKNMFVSLAIAFIVVGLLMVILFRSGKMILISIIPNILPLLIIGAVIGFLGIQLNGSISIIFTISFVIAVDDTIHFLSKFKLEKKKCSNMHEALQNTINETGKAIIITSLVFLFGFIVLIFSDFRGVFYHGILISITSLVAVFADLFLLPVLLQIFFKKEFNNKKV